MMLFSVGISIYIIVTDLDLSLGKMTKTIVNSKYSTIFNWDWSFEKNFYKQFLINASITFFGLWIIKKEDEIA